MTTLKVKSAWQVKQIEFCDLPEGLHDGVYSGNRVTFSVDGTEYQLRTRESVKGLVDCKVHVYNNGDVSVAVDFGWHT